MQTKARTFLFLFTSIFSLYILNSCASSPKNEENLTQAEQSSDKKTEEIPEDQLENKEISQDSLANEENLQNSENTQNKPENDENQLSEKIDEDELLADSENETEETQEDFVEPEVKDSLFVEETKTAADGQNPESSENKQNKAQDIPETNEEEPELLPKTEENSGEENPQTDENLELNENSMENQENLPQNGQEPENKDELSEEIEEEEPKENTEQTESNPQKTPSRSMTAKNNQYVDIIYPGRGWIYMGEDEGKDQILRYFGRKLGTENTTFTLRTTKSGETVLHFYKNDVLKGEYIDDYLEIKVLEESAKPNERAKAPSYEESVPQKPVRLEKKAETQEEAQKTDEIKNIEEKTSDNEQKLSSQDEINLKKNDVSNEVSRPEQKKSLKIDTKNLLEQAKKDFEAKSYAQALSEVQQYLDTQNTRIDEALFLQGQILEADSEVKNIKSAIDSYNSLIKNYPASTFWQEANRRKIYLNRYYVNIY
ncbi:hypothetical protein SAMN02745152_00546 [Treponema berlinense]|uniref:Outer membrane lipoprotein BamD-like domain-containing protein n=2 Tax=Treponema berlinense TaxID=225004 RepID=A0A1T4LII1_9SPIR|nr:hypothetical protein SAMN02745152_00546 [Treponema berlinense]